MLTEAAGVPVAVAVGGANRRDLKMARETAEAIVADRPPAGPGRAGPGRPQGLCLGRDYDYGEAYALCAEFGFTAHVRARGEEARALKRSARKRARRWVVERTHSWFDRFRGVLTRWSKKPDNYLARLHLVCAVISYRCAGLSG